MSILCLLPQVQGVICLDHGGARENDTSQEFQELQVCYHCTCRNLPLHELLQKQGLRLPLQDTCVLNQLLSVQAKAQSLFLHGNCQISVPIFRSWMWGPLYLYNGTLKKPVMSCVWRASFSQIKTSRLSQHPEKAHGCRLKGSQTKSVKY